ncbi:uncharacterized protein B0H18DRAFT_986789 [Fomitopsis serialis]|uniref:uncharacterized protein n=1 Tax=Fomitopsis serialis TaxID=139415 RepID=UPI002008DC3E|nr:uncharacterized protein B0H18DRAFT_986789 [Neoantrodia serialis]KAH9932636.1 hypothetical protein B0H18DRAFT_986789 [Neoantrodia serialis]
MAGSAWLERIPGSAVVGRGALAVAYNAAMRCTLEGGLPTTTTRFTHQRELPERLSSLQVLHHISAHRVSQPVPHTLHLVLVFAHAVDLVADDVQDAVCHRREVGRPLACRLFVMGCARRRARCMALDGIDDGVDGRDVRGACHGARDAWCKRSVGRLASGAERKAQARAAPPRLAEIEGAWTSEINSQGLSEEHRIGRRRQGLGPEAAVYSNTHSPECCS